MTTPVEKPIDAEIAPTAADSRPYWRYALALAVTGVLCGVLLGGLSAWFLGSVALAGLTTAAFAFNFHTPGALVRLFAIGRTVARYGERLAGHKAALTDQVARRAAIFRAMASAPATRAASWQFGDQARLTDYLDDVEDIDYARLRVDLPAAMIGLGLLGGAIATLIVAPWGVLPPAALLAFLALFARKARRAIAATHERARADRSDGASRLGAALAAVVPLRAERAWERSCVAALARFNEADSRVLAIRRMQAACDAAAVLIGPVAALSTLGAAWLQGARGEAFLTPVFLAFAWLALGELTQNASRLLVADVRRAAALRSAAAWTPPDAQPAARPMRRVRRLDSGSLQRRAPDGRPIGRALPLTLKTGSPLILTGPSGAGKTSLLKQIAGWTSEDVFVSDEGPVSAAERRGMAMYCPHDAAVLADTVRANLFAASREDSELRDALAAVELADRIAEAGGLDAWITQDMLSLGEAQRLNLARAWLSDKPLILLDEPTEHLDAAQGRRIIARLLARLSDRMVALSSHRAIDAPGAAVTPL
ncbi:MAG: hypothetical protein BGP06_01925 [Rhizobiales bacterium 65-9]|nr:ATP-binding cassette domain-containing protein [Hyphomicrobiales bacterium]OJY34252.1 MAG: hypothetical protein BGP06_01925 [Rhizobiales bacterium 65-9]